MEIKVDSQAPEFSASDQDGKIRKLSDYKGKWVLLYFYPSDFTPGCTTEACEMRDNFEELQKHLTVLGVSKNNAKSHKRFAEKYELPFTLLSDTDKIMTEAYGAGGLIFAKRVSFLIDPERIIRKIYNNVVPAAHAKEVIEDIKKIQNE